MEITYDLFGRPCLIRKWGRVGTRGRLIEHRFGDEREAVQLFLDILRLKRNRGYRPKQSSEQTTRQDIHQAG